MPDIFVNNVNEESINKINNSSKNYWNTINEQQAQKNAEYQELLNRYTIDIPQEQYNVIKDVIADAENPEDEAYRWASALELNKQYGLPVDYAYANLEQISKAKWGEEYTFTPKTNFKAIVDSGRQGVNTLKMGMLGAQIMKAEMGDRLTELYTGEQTAKPGMFAENSLESLLVKYEELEKQNEGLQDYQDRNFIIECLKFGAQSAPFTGSVIAASAVGSLVAPGVGTAAAFATSMANAAGLQYMQMRKDGSSVEAAAGFSLVSGALQAVVETSLGNVAGALGRKSLGDLASEAVKQKITGNVFKRLVSDGTFKSLGLRLTKEYLKENIEEGIEEVTQDFIEKATMALAAELGEYKVDGLDAATIARETWENFKGGVMGSLVLGLPTSAIKVKASVKEFAAVKKAAEVIPSQEAFNKVTEDSIIWDGLSKEEKKEAQKNTWEQAQARVEAAAEIEAKKIAEVQDAAEGADERKVNEEGDEQAQPVARDENGKLMFSDDENISEDGIVSGTFRAGDKTKAENNRYGYIKYTADEKNKTVTVDDFKMAAGREGLRGEVYDEFARKYAGYSIEWNAVGSEAASIKESLINNNPAGAKAGLSYYADEDAVYDASTRAKVAAEVKKNIHNVSRVTDENGNVSFKRSELTNEQVSSAVALLEAAAKRTGMNLTEYVNKTFGNEIFGSQEDFSRAASAQGDNVSGKAGGVNPGVAQNGWKQFGQQVKAVIYAGENADFSTWAHELAHIFQSQLDGDLKAQAEKAFNVVGGDWINSTYTFKDGHTDSAAEAFAYGFQDWLKTGKAESEEMKNIFQKFAEFIVSAFNSLKDFINLTPEITSVYEQLLAGDDSLMAQAEHAVEEGDRRYRAEMKKKAEEAENNRKAEAEKEKQSEQAKREEAGEITEFTEENTAEQIAEAEKTIDEVTSYDTEEENNAIDDALENTNLTDEEKGRISEVLKNENSTVIEKAEAATEIASSVYDNEDVIPDELFFQGELTDDELKNIFNNQDHTETRQKYIDDYYTNRKNEYEIKSFTSSDGTITANLEVYKNRDFKQTDIDNGLFFANKGIDVTLLPEGETDNEKNIDALFYHNALVEFKQVITDKPKNIAQEIKDAANKMNSEVISVFFTDKAKNVNYDDVIAAINFKKGKGDFKGDYDELLFVKDGEVTRLNKNAASPAEANTDRTSNIAQETDTVKQKYQNTDKWLKAPNGADTKLDEKQWLQVRTPSFKKWFGDWENDKENVSKVVDENGEPMVMYHGTPYYGFNIFRSESYFTKNKDYAEVYKNKNPMNATQHGIYDVFLNVKKPFDTRNEKDKKIFYDEFYQKWGNGADLINGLPDWTDAPDLIEFAKEKGYDGVYVDEGVTQGKAGLEKAGYSVIPAESNQIKSATDNNGNFDASNPNILFQDVYHGSPFNFENFSTENIGTGEGAQAFGWGLYFTNQEGIARFYADKLANEPKRISLISKNEYLKSRKKSLRDVENKEKYEARITKNINHFRKELKQAQKAGDESEIKFYEGLIDDSIKQLDENERLSLIESFKKDIATAEQEIAELKASMKNNRNLYTVEIPDEGYVKWDEEISKKQLQEIYNKLSDEQKERYNTLDFDNPDFADLTGELLYDNILPYVLGYATNTSNYNHKNDKEVSLFLKDVGYIGIDYPANSFSGYTTAGERNYVIFDEANASIKKHLLYQKVYHGSGADFDKFDTESYGLSGEGSMSFGYGTYVTDSEEIARDYAERQRKSDNALDIAYSMLEANNFDKTIVEKELQEWIAQGNDAETYQKALEYIQNNSVEELKNKHNTNLYTIEIPDNGYIVWDKDVDTKTKKFVENAVYDKLTTEPNEDGDYVYKGAERELREELQSTFEADINGEELYNDVVVYLGDEKAASKFLNKLGFVGIDYPAYSNFGNAMGKSARNFVIFNDEDAKIVDHLFFQTQAELVKEAQDFDNWQDFMENCESMHVGVDDVTPIPSDADAQWYQSFYETANGIQTEQERNEQIVDAENKRDGMLPGAVDALFTTYIKSQPEMIDNFLQAVADIDAIDLDSEEWQHAESSEDAAQRERIEQLKDFINITLSDYNWQTALKRIQGGNEIAEGLRKRLIGEMTDSFKVRDFRALYAEIMNDEQYAVAPEDSITATLNKKLKKYHDIVKPNEDISKWSPEKRKRLAEQLQNKEIAAKIRNGSLKLDDELDAYIKSLDKQIKEKQKQFDELEAETKADYQRIADKERRDLLKLHEQLLIARSKLNKNNSEINRKIAKGLKITEKYRYATQNLNANYDEIFRKYNDLKNTQQITADVQAALDRQEKIAGLKDDLNAKQKEKNLTAEVKKMRIQLVKRTMRRVPFNRIDYNNAKTVIAIQRMLEPNLLGGVNRFIGIDSPYLRGVISQIVTDADYKEKIMSYLRHNSKASQAFVDFKKKLEELKSIKDFDSWTAKERKAAIRYLPKENWVRDLNLKQLAKEREESIDLDIGMEEVKRTVYDEKTGEPKTYKDKEGNEYNVTETAFRLKANPDIERIVQDAVGADMFDKIVNMPFSEWTTEDLEQLAQRIDELYTEGRDLKAAKDEARKRAASAIRQRIEDAIKETGITINDDDTPEEKERKQAQIDKILGMSSDLIGTEAGKSKGFKAKITRLLHSYSDMNVLRFARMLDGQNEGENYRMLYRMEDDCYNAKQRSISSRASTVNKVMADNKITEGDLAKSIKVDSLGTEFTVDELLYFLAADKDYVEDEKKLQRGDIGIDANDDYAATSRNAVMFGNMMSDMLSQEEKEAWLKLDQDMQNAIANDALTPEQKQLEAAGMLDKRPGTTRYIEACHAKWEVVLSFANRFLDEHPEYRALMEAIEADYASQYERMNEVSINEFNTPVHRVKAYVPLVRRESNGADNVAQVKEDLLATYGGEAGKQWVNKGMTQRRVNISPLNQKPVQTGLFRTWGDSIERTEHFIAYAPYVRQLNAVYKSRDASSTRRFIESRYGKSAIEYLDAYINEVANPNAGKIREKGAELFHVLRGKTAPAYLGWKASGIIKQGLTSPFPYMQFVNPAEYLSAAMKFTFNPEMREAISEKSIYMKMRRMDPVNDLIDEMAENAKGQVDRAWTKFSQMGMQGLEFIDWACVAPGWLACYEKKYNQLQNANEARYNAKMEELKERNMYADIGTSEYLSPEQMEAQARSEMLEDIESEAIRYADDCTRACQPSNRVTDLAPLFKNSSEAMKAFLQFQTSLNVIWQNIRYDLPYAVKQKEFKRIAGTVIGYVMAGIFMNSVMDGVRGDDDDDEMQALRNLIYYSTTQFTDAIPIMGSEITNAMDKIITGKRAYSQSGTDMTPSATKLLSALQSVTNGDFKKAAGLTAEGIGLFLGAPVSGVKEINKLLGKPLSEGEIDIKKGVGDVYGIVGDILEE